MARPAKRTDCKVWPANGQHNDDDGSGEKPMPAQQLAPPRLLLQLRLDFSSIHPQVVLRLVPGRHRQLELMNEIDVFARSGGLGLCSERDCGRGGQEEEPIKVKAGRTALQRCVEFLKTFQGVSDAVSALE